MCPADGIEIVTVRRRRAGELDNKVEARACDCGELLSMDERSMVGRVALSPLLEGVHGRVN
jgi:hypothetical protein